MQAMIKASTSVGHDNISIIKFAFDSIADPLRSLINLSLFKGAFPNELKIAKIIPVFKNDDEKLISNYRPIFPASEFFQIFRKSLL